MDFVPTIKRMIDYQKTAFNSFYNTIVILQGQIEKLTAEIMEKSAIPKAILESFENTLNGYKESQGHIKTLMEDSFDKFVTMLSSENEDSHAPVTKQSQKKMPV